MNDATTTPLPLWKDRWAVLAAIICMILLAASAWYLARGGAWGKPVPYTHLHCPECDEEIDYRKELDGKQCENCTKKAKLVPTIGSIWQGGRSGNTGQARLFVFLLIVAVVGQGFAYFCVIRKRRLLEAHSKTVQQALTCKCPFCRRKFRYPISREGSGATCSACKKPFTLPAPEPVG